MAPSGKQLALLHVAKNQLGLDDSAWRALLSDAALVESASDLDNRGFDEVLEALKDLGFKTTADPARARPAFGECDGKASNAQIAKVRRLWFEYSGRDDDKPLSKWLQSSFKVSALRFLDYATASRVIEALKKMAARPRRQEAQDGP